MEETHWRAANPSRIDAEAVTHLQPVVTFSRCFTYHHWWIDPLRFKEAKSADRKEGIDAQARRVCCANGEAFLFQPLCGAKINGVIFPAQALKSPRAQSICKYATWVTAGAQPCRPPNFQ